MSWQSVVGAILGLLSILLSWLPGVGIVFAIAGVLLAKKGVAIQKDGISLGSYVLTLVSLVVSIVILLGYGILWILK